MIKALGYKPLSALALLVACSTVHASIIGTIQAGFVGTTQGYAYIRGVVLSEAGNRIWATYNPDNGQHVDDIGEATGDLDSAQWPVLSRTELENYHEQYESLLEAYIRKYRYRL